MTGFDLVSLALLQLFSVCDRAALPPQDVAKLLSFVSTKAYEYHIYRHPFRQWRFLL